MKGVRVCVDLERKAVRSSGRCGRKGREGRSAYCRDGAVAGLLFLRGLLSRASWTTKLLHDSNGLLEKRREEYVGWVA